MQVGAIGGYSFQPYIYNTNSLSADSLNKIKGIGQDADVTEAKTDYSSLTDNSQNINPLKKGETANFADIFEMQMRMSQENASRLLA